MACGSQHPKCYDCKDDGDEANFQQIKLDLSPRIKQDVPKGLLKLLVNKASICRGVSQSGNALTSLIHSAAKGRSVSQLMNELHCAVPSSTQIGTSPFYIGSQDDCDLRIKDPFIASVCMRLDYEEPELFVTAMVPGCVKDGHALEVGEQQVMMDGCNLSVIHTPEHAIHLRYLAAQSTKQREVTKMEKKAADFFCKGDVGTPDFMNNGLNGCYAVSALHAMAGSRVLINGLWNEARETSLAGKFVRQLIKWRGIFLRKWMEKMATREINKKRLRSEAPQVISATHDSCL